MNIQEEARARHITAFVEEVLGGGASRDLPARIEARLAATPRARSRATWLAAVLVGIAVVAATAHLVREGNAPVVVATQDPVRARDEVVALRIRGTGPGAVEWRLGERRGTTADWLASELRAAIAAAKRGAVVPELVIEPEPGTEWRHVAAATDAGHAAGFLSIRFARVDAQRIVAKQVARPDGSQGAMLAEVRFSEPDDRPAAERPVLDVFVDGRIVNGDEVLFEPAGQHNEPGDTTQLVAYFADQRSRLAALGERELPPSGRKVLTTPLLLRIDRGAEWRFVQLAMRLAKAAAGFDEVHVAVVGPRGAGEAVRAEKR